MTLPAHYRDNGVHAAAVALVLVRNAIFLLLTVFLDPLRVQAASTGCPRTLRQYLPGAIGDHFALLPYIPHLRQGSSRRVLVLTWERRTQIRYFEGQRQEGRNLFRW